MNIEKLEGKTIQSIEKYNSYVLIIFTDGTVVAISSNGTEEYQEVQVEIED